MPRQVIKLRSGLTLKQAIALLDNPDFRLQARNLRDFFADPSQFGGTKQVNELCLRALVGGFEQDWGVLPPVKTEELFADPWTRIGRAVEAGRWGLIPVYPWTTETEVQAARRRIQRKTGKQHADAASGRKAEIAFWLALQTDAKDHPLSRAEIVRAVWGRTRGLRRPTRSQAIAQLSEAQEEALTQKYMRQGLSREEVAAMLFHAEKQIKGRARGSEAKGLMQLRQTLARYQKNIQKKKTAIAAPKECDPLAYPITMAIRGLLVSPVDVSSVLRWIQTLADRLLGVD